MVLDGRNAGGDVALSLRSFPAASFSARHIEGTGMLLKSKYAVCILAVFALASCGQGAPSVDSTPAVSAAESPCELNVGEIIEFGGNPSASVCLNSGWWGVVEPGGVWSNAAEVTITLIAQPRDRADIVISISATPFLSLPQVARQRVRASLNSQTLGEFEFVNGGDTAFTLTVPSAAIPRDGALNIVLSLPDSVVPASVGISPDERRLALLLRSVQRTS